MATTSWTLTCFNAIFNPNDKQLKGDRIIVPQKVLDDIKDIDRDFYQFAIKNSTGRQTVCCRVEEFCAGDNMHIYMPSWMMHNLYLNDMDEAELCLLKSEIETAKKIVVQPHDSIFLTLSDHKTVLENSLGLFSSLTRGTSISITHDDSEFSLSVVEIGSDHKKYEGFRFSEFLYIPSRDLPYGGWIQHCLFCHHETTSTEKIEEWKLYICNRCQKKHNSYEKHELCSEVIKYIRRLGY